PRWRRRATARRALGRGAARGRRAPARSGAPAARSPRRPTSARRRRPARRASSAAGLSLGPALVRELCQLVANVPELRERLLLDQPAEQRDRRPLGAHDLVADDAGGHLVVPGPPE